jgi:hypothetical protein
MQAARNLCLEEVWESSFPAYLSILATELATMNDCSTTSSPVSANRMTPGRTTVTPKRFFDRSLEI